MRRQVVWRNYSEQMTEKQKSVKTCTKSPKKATTFIYGNYCSSDQKAKSCPNKADMNRLKSKKAVTCYTKKSFFKNRSQLQQLISSVYQPTQPRVNFLIKTCLRSDFSSQSLLKLNNFSLCRKRCATTIKHKAVLMILQSLQFILFCVQKMILYRTVVKSLKSLFLSITLCTSLMRRTS